MEPERDPSIHGYFHPRQVNLQFEIPHTLLLESLTDLYTTYDELTIVSERD